MVGGATDISTRLPEFGLAAGLVSAPEMPDSAPTTLNESDD
jgi:hypothetical protein